MAANTTTWNGSVDSDWDTAGNWSSGVPDADSTVVIDGTVDITGGEPSAAVFQRLFVTYSYTGSIGSAGTPLEIDCSQVSHDSTASSSTAYIDLLGATHTTPDVTSDGSNAGSALVISGAIDRLFVPPTMVGDITLGNGASFTADIKDLYMLASSGTIHATNATNLNWQSSGTIRMTAGTINIGENFGTNSNVVISGGTITVSEWTATTGDSITILGGNVVWDAGGASFDVGSISVNTVRTLTVIGGSFSLASNVNASITFDKIYQFGGTVDMESTFANVIYNDSYERFGGTYVPPKQSSIGTTVL